MVRLVRIAKMKGDWDKFDAAMTSLDKIYRSHPEVKEVSYWNGITGRLDHVQVEILFDSMADEEKWAKRIMEDPKYRELMGDIMGMTTDAEDFLYRRWEGMPE